MNRGDGNASMQHQKENMEDNPKSTCASNRVQESNETMSCDSMSEGNIDSLNGFQNVQNSQTTSEKSNVNTDGNDKIDVDNSVS